MGITEGAKDGPCFFGARRVKGRLLASGGDCSRIPAFGRTAERRHRDRHRRKPVRPMRRRRVAGDRRGGRRQCAHGKLAHRRPQSRRDGAGRGLEQIRTVPSAEWSGVVAIAAGWRRTVALRADGTVVAVGWNNQGQCDVGRWREIVAVAAGDWHTVGLLADGTVVAVGNDVYSQCRVGSWRDVAAIAAGYLHTVGLRTDGTVVAVGSNKSGQCDVDSWRDIVAVAAGSHHTVGLKADGT